MSRRIAQGLTGMVSKHMWVPSIVVVATVTLIMPNAALPPCISYLVGYSSVGSPIIA